MNRKSLHADLGSQGLEWCLTTLLALSVGCGASQDAPEPSAVTARQSLAAPVVDRQAVAAGAYHSLALREDGGVWSWGRDTEGQLGQGTSSQTPRPVPAPVSLPRPMKAIAAGAGHSLSLDVDGYVWAWGRNTRGQAGVATSTTPLLKPTRVPGLPRIQVIAAREDLSLAVDANGDLWAWGQNTDGELGQGVADTNAHPVPVKVVVPALLAGDTYLPAGPAANPQDVYTFVKVAAGGHHVLALTRSGRVWSWGRNSSAQVGTNAATEAPVLTPTLLRFESLVVDIAAGENHSVLLDAGDRRPWAWGSNTAGQASRTWNGLDQPVTPFPTYPQGYTFLGSAIAAGDAFSLFLGARNPGQIRAWGDNTFGQVGDGSGLRRPEPVAVLQYKEPYGLVDTEWMLAISAGARHALAVHDGCPSVWAWGDNSQGQLGVQGGVSAPVLHAQRSLPLKRFYRDTDGDGFGDKDQLEQTCTPSSEEFVEGIDCDDTRPGIHPGATEVCDSLDNNCDGAVDDNGCAVWYRDADGDGYGIPNDTKQSGVQPQGYVDNASDCDDTRSNVRPGAAEVCDGMDNNCDGQADEALPTQPWCQDFDGDGLCGPAGHTFACMKPPGHIAPNNTLDCDDHDASVGGVTTHYQDADGDGLGNGQVTVQSCGPSAGHVSNDDDCDDATPSIGAPTVYYQDADQDGLGNGQASLQACAQPQGYTLNASDCDDTNIHIRHPSRWFRDLDTDGYGDPYDWHYACGYPAGHVQVAEDCDDADSTVRPGAEELCDGLDNNCDGRTDEGHPWYCRGDW
ncbi:MopE-related protein [Corallococcus aberystwythensis]|uniref:MopE-related protein n=1 Tax=Corallococcus aberystwythensis TaxID=2316722 RepID=UPI0013158DB4|nr:MopE-related protein [Corallococcus aberystwythensis]